MFKLIPFRDFISLDQIKSKSNGLFSTGLEVTDVRTNFFFFFGGAFSSPRQPTISFLWAH